MKIKKSFNSALLLLLGALVVAVTLLGAGQNASGTNVASAAAPHNLNAIQAAAPNVGAWTVPVPVTNGSGYDNRPLIAASLVSGAVSVFWAQVPGQGDGWVTQSSNTVLGGPFLPQVMDTYNTGQNEVMDATNDILGRRHVIYWTYGPSGGFCDKYAVVETTGFLSTNEVIPGSCGNNTPRKIGGLWVDNNLTTHIAVGRNLQTGSLIYWQRQNSGVYNIVGENITGNCCPSDVALTVTTQGVIMVVFKSSGISGTGSDIYTATRLGDSNWQIDDISAECCDYCPARSNAYLPELAASPDGGVRAVWADGRCDGIEQTDIYYREWFPATGWNNQPIVRVVYNSGASYWPSIAVDSSGESHLTWSDDTSSPFDYYRMFYSHGRGGLFTPVEIPFQPWAGSAYQKENDSSYGAGYLHVSFSSPRNDPQKDGFYSYLEVAAPATPTPVPTATAPPPPCPANGTFRDVCPGYTVFAQYIESLAADQIVSGYNTSPPCPSASWVPCFLPNNTATRAQMSKIVVAAANLPIDTTGGPHFQDVISGSTFYNFIETAYNAAIVNGYPCGGPGEPCVTPGNKPYFRANNSITRGQVAKMASLAFGLSGAPSGQTFQDVPPGSTFYSYVESIANLGIINGYPCGGPGEPCVAPGNRPYYRPGNNVTRGQAAKILDLFRQIPTPTPVASPTATQTGAEGTATPSVTSTVALTQTVAETATETATAVSTATYTPQPTSTETATATQTPGLRANR
ncbi:MAG: S-layer homology domain-containing protein [Chloroflexota bacterium]